MCVDCRSVAKIIYGRYLKMRLREAPVDGEKLNKYCSKNMDNVLLARWLMLCSETWEHVREETHDLGVEWIAGGLPKKQVLDKYDPARPYTHRKSMG